ncbi:hypothetical protein GGP41_003926 [Bipolaris sorokiniana]|uniref:Uncharacterized protein n=1 Tax=Cochliobolus sativus TaxID=45130 RepID=A0A8H5ZJ20_COCSA|nr:hypothetical protein GGP41_003926 [Bipolaris sorokiniana]
MGFKDGEKLRFDNRIVIITSAEGEHAKLFGRIGANVIVNELFEEPTKETVVLITEAGGNAIAAFGSVADRKTCEAIVTTAIKQYRRVDVLIKNAGIEIKKPFEDMTVDDLSRMLDVHVMGSWHLPQLLWPHMKLAGYGKIIMVHFMG